MPLAALTFVLMATEGSVGDWSGTYLARSGVDVGATAAGYAAFSLLMITGRLVGDGIVGAAGPRATVGLGALIAAAGLAISAAWPGLAGGVIGFGLVGAGLANVVPVLFERRGAGWVVAGGRRRLGRNRGLCGSARRAGRHWRGRFRCGLTLDDRHAGGRRADFGRIRVFESGRPSRVTARR